MKLIRKEKVKNIILVCPLIMVTRVKILGKHLSAVVQYMIHISADNDACFITPATAYSNFSVTLTIHQIFSHQ